jgi:CubicO group peptidase (beta-lactamase class C family)
MPLSKTNIFNPLGMNDTSFYLTPDLVKNKVPLNIRRDGKLEVFDPNERLFETDPGKGNSQASTEYRLY